MNACPVFDTPFTGDPLAPLGALAAQVREFGGLLTGTAQQGTFSFRVAFGGRPVRGRYAVVESAIRVQITDRPMLLSCAQLTEAFREILATEAPGPNVPGPIPTEFNIEVRFLGGLAATQQDVFMGAAARWSRIIVGDLPAVRLPSGAVVDDVVIDARGALIDGDGRVLGRAGPTALRPGSMLPVTGMMEFDTADLARMEMDGSLQNVIVHEMGHVLGIGSIWDLLGLLRGGGGRNPLFTGGNAMREFGALLGTGPRPVPVENTGGGGTADAHWRETVFMSELMTGFINGGVNPLSRVTVGSLQDLGYQVNYAAADAYTLPTEQEIRLLGLSSHVEQCGGAHMSRPAPIVLPEGCVLPDE